MLMQHLPDQGERAAEAIRDQLTEIDACVPLCPLSSLASSHAIQAKGWSSANANAKSVS